MQHATAGLETFVAGKSLEDFKRELMLRRAVERLIIFLGGAMIRARKVDTAIPDSISDYRTVIALRDSLLKHYNTINDEITWKFVIDKLPILRSKIDALLVKS